MSTKEIIVQKIKEIPEVKTVGNITSVDLVGGQTLLQMNVYFDTDPVESPPPLGIHVAESVNAEDRFGG